MSVIYRTTNRVIVALGVLGVLVGSRLTLAAPCFDGGSCCFDSDPGTSTQVCESNENLFTAIGVYWKDTQEGIGTELGVHLRWSFTTSDDPDTAENEELGFPEGGFEIQRRAEGSHQFAWRTLGRRIYPSTTGDEARSRIPASVTAPECCGYRQGADDLVDLIELGFCEAGDSYWWYEQDDAVTSSSGIAWKESDLTSPEFVLYESEFEANLGRPPLGFEFKPLDFINVIALDPVVARMLGLYYVDTTAAPNVRYDYRIVAHYSGRDPICALVFDVGGPTTPELDAPDPVVAYQATATELEDVEGSQEGDRSQTWVNLEWTHEIGEVLAAAGKTPDEGLSIADGILPIRYLVLRQDATTGGEFERIEIQAGTVTDDCVVADSDECAILGAPVVVGTNEVDDGSGGLELAFKEPPYYRDTKVEVDEWYEYRVHGVDIFGRYSPPDDSPRVTIVDLSPPPPPIVTETRFFQLEDPALLRLPQSERKAVRGTASHASFGTSVVLRARWIWPEKFLTSHDDVTEFRVYVRNLENDGLHLVETVPIEDVTDDVAYPSFNPATCVDGLDNDGDGLSDAADPDCSIDGAAEDGDDIPPDPANYYERYVPIASFVASAPVSDDNPDEKTRFYEIEIKSVDTWGNESLGEEYRSRKVVLADFIAPDPSSSPDLVLGTVGEPDAEGQVSLWLEWPSIDNLTYRVYRASQQSLCDAMIGAGTPVPSCAIVSDGDLQLAALAHPEVFVSVTGHPLGPFTGGVATFVDFVPGTSANRYVYVACATDPAANVGPRSGPGTPIFVPDKFPPAKPVITKATADATGQVTVRWLRGNEDDIASYTLYRTDNPSYVGSKRKMTEVTQKTSVVSEYSYIDLPGRPQNLQYYRVEAVDTSGNHSLLSEVVVVNPVDTFAPDATLWGITARWRCIDGSAGIRLSVTVPDAPDEAGEYRLLRSRGGNYVAFTAWMSEDETVADEGLDPNEAHDYRLEVRDASGNKSQVDATVPPRGSDPCSKSTPDLVATESNPQFVRGDTDGNGSLEPTDAIRVLIHLYLQPDGLGCLDAADVDATGQIGLDDAIRLLGFVFVGQAAPAAPFPLCGAAEERGLGCREYPGCR